MLAQPIKSPAEPESPPAAAPTHPQSATTQVITALTTILDAESSAKHGAACAVYDAAVQGDGADPQMACLDLLTALGGDACIVVRALKLVHQGVVLYALSALREIVKPVEIMTKDVRSNDGWLIHLDMFDSFRIRHVRREQSLDLWGDATDHFEYEFEISATMDRELHTVHATWLRVNEVFLAETMVPARRAELTAALGSGGRILA